MVDGFNGDEADFSGGFKPVQGAANQTEAAFAEAKSGGPDGGETGIAKFAGLGAGHGEAEFFDKVAEGLRIPGVKMVVGFVATKTIIPGLAFQGDEKEEAATRREQSMNFAEHGGRVDDVLQGVVADNRVDRGVVEGLGIGDKLKAERSKGRFEEVIEVEGEFAAAVEVGEVPAQARAIFQDDIAGCDVGRELFGAQSRNPGKGHGRDAALMLVVAAAGLATITALCLVEKHAAQCKAARLIRQSNSA